MRPVITDADTGRLLWRTADCAEFTGLTIRTWSGYAARGQRPASVAHLDARTPLWDAEEVRAWQAGGPRARKG